MWMWVLWLAGQRSCVVGSWGIYTGPVREHTRDTNFSFQEEGNWQNTVIKSHRYIIPCATAKIPRKPHVQEIFCNETGQITQHSVSSHHRLWNRHLTLGQRTFNQDVLYHVVPSDVYVYSLPRANTPLLRSIVPPLKINCWPNHPKFAIPNSPLLPGWGQRAVCGTKTTHGIALYRTCRSLHSENTTSFPLPWLSIPITHAASYPFLFSTELTQAKLFITGMDTPPFPLKHVPPCYSTGNATSINIKEYLSAFLVMFQHVPQAMDNPRGEWDPALHLTT